jgi:hypothetical protein
MRPDGTPGKAFHRRDREDRREVRLPQDPNDRELEACRTAYENAGRLDALAEAIGICRDLTRPLPDWLALAAMGALDARFEPRAQDLVDFVRFDAVDDARNHKLTLERAFDFASQLLEPTDARGSADAMKKSYYLVGRRTRREPGRYYLTRALSRLLQRYHAPKGHAFKVIAAFPEGHTGPEK